MSRREACAHLLGALLALGLAAHASVPRVALAAADTQGPLGARLAQLLGAREYHASRNREGLQAPNRVHDLRIYFEETGIRVYGRSDAPGSALLTLGLMGVGRGEALTPLGPGEVSSEGARVEIRRPGLVEWYENAPAGLEQGFTLSERGPGRGALVLELAATGARVSQSGERIVFETLAGRILHYEQLRVFDASGRRLPARFHVPDPTRLRIVVADADALYPVVVDPLLVAAPDARLESNQTDARLGFRVAGAGDVNADGYDDVIVGAYRYDAGEVDEGAAFVFLGGPSGIADAGPSGASAKLESDQVGAELGISVAGAGDVDGDGYGDVIVGARFYDDGQQDEGAAFVFRGGPAGILAGTPGTAATRLQSDQAGAAFGGSVAGAGDVNGDGRDDVIVGAYLFDATQADEGAAFVFLGSPTGIDHGTAANAASRIESDQESALLGIDVARAGDVDGDGYGDVIVGAPFYDSDETNEGAAFVFRGGASGVAGGTPADECAQLESNQVDANLGVSVAGAGDLDGDGYGDVIVGADEYDAGEISEGAAFIFHGSAGGIADGTPGSAATRLQSDQTGADFGISVAGAGDLDGDGYDDVLVGAYLHDAVMIDDGAAFVFRGSASGIGDANPANAAAVLGAGQTDAEFGRSVAGAGDVDGDGLADVIVGASAYDDGHTDEGAAFIFLRGGLPLPVPALGAPALAVLGALLLRLARPRRGHPPSSCARRA